MPIFRVKSVKIYTGQFFFTQTPSVVSVTNIRYDSDFSDQWVTFELDSFCVRDFSLLVIVRTQPTQSRLWSDLGPMKKERWYSNLKFKLEASKLCDIIICKVFYFPTLWSLNSPHWENIQIEKWKVQLQIEMLW